MKFILTDSFGYILDRRNRSSVLDVLHYEESIYSDLTGGKTVDEAAGIFMDILERQRNNYWIM